MSEAIADLKVYIPANDKNREYRKSEILPEVAPVLERSRVHRGAIHITQRAIDKLISIQNADPARAVAWLRWRYLGEITYKEAFIDPATIPIEDRIAAQGKQIEDLKQQIEELKQLIINDK